VGDARSLTRPPAATMPGTSLVELAVDFDLTLAAEGKSPATRKVYGLSVHALDEFLRSRGMPRDVHHITREHVAAYVADVLDHWTASTARTRYGGLLAFFKYVTEDLGEIERSPMARMSPPKVPDPLVPILSDDDLRRLLKSCDGKDFASKRDLAILRVFIDTGMRRGEMTGIKLTDIDAETGTVTVFGKGSRYRTVQLGNNSLRALRAYLRARARHPHQALDALWLARDGALRETGITQMLKRRAADVGIKHLHPHMLRHQFAHDWLAAGGTEGDLMALGGWRSRQMLDRYGRAGQEARARDAHRRLAPGDRF
jgi:site-specific recombinase XerD